MATSVAVTAQAVPGATETSLVWTRADGGGTFTTVPLTKTLVLSVIRAANISGTAKAAHVSRVPLAGTAGTANRIIPGMSVPANDALTDETAHVLLGGQFLSAKADDSNVVFTASGVLFL